MAGRSEPFEQDHFGADDPDAGRAHPLDRQIAVPGGAGRHGVRRDVDPVAGLRQAQRGLQHADMGLHTAQYGIAPSGSGEHGGQPVVGLAREMHLVEDPRRIGLLPHGGDGRPEAAGILFRDRVRHAQQGRGVEKNAGAFGNPLTVQRGGRQPFLDVDEQQLARIGVHHGVAIHWL